MIISRFSVYKVVVGHVLFWIAYIYYDGIILNWQDADELRFQFNFYIGGPSILISIVLTYFNLFVLLPAFYYKNRFTWYTIALCLSLFTGAVLTRLITHTFIVPWEKIHDVERYKLEVKHFWIPVRILRLAIQYYPVIAIVTVFELMRRAWENEKRLRDAERERSLAEISFLKAQINPHFFFNTLNSLYALTLKRSDHAAKLVMQLSGLMRYRIYRVDADDVDLSEEINELTNYMAIEQTRFGDRLDLSYHCSGDITGKRIIPLVLLPYAENAFKHGIEEGKGWITISLKIEAGNLLYIVENSVQPGYTKKTGGIGVANLRRRLELAYPNRYELSTRKENGAFEAILKIAL